MEGKEEISDTDSGIILHSSPDSPTTVMKDVLTHTRAMKLKHQSLEDRLELCLVELKKLCIREAELTGRLSEDYPFLPGEKPPQVRRRIGAAFKLDKQSIPHGAGDSELNSVESELALQLQIHEASRRLCQEEHLGKAVKRSRVQQCKREEKKVKELQETAFQLRLQHGRTSPRPGCINTQRDQGTSDNSSLSDSVVLDEEEVTIQSSQPCLEPPYQGPAESSQQPLGFSQPPVHTPYQSPSVSSLPLLQSPHQPSLLSLEEPRLSFSIDHEAPPIQHSPWSESSLDQPYQKSKKSRSGSSKSSSPAVTPVLPPVEACLGDLGLPVKVSNLRLCHPQSSSAPSTPEMQLRRQLSLRFPSTEPSFGTERSRDRTRGPRRRLTDYMVPSLEPPLPRMNNGNPMYHSGSEDSSSEHSAPSYAGSLCQEVPCQPTYQHLHSSPNNNQAPLPYSGPGFYQNSKNQSSPSIHREYYEDGIVYPHDMVMGRGYYCQPAQSPSTRYEHWYEGPPVYPPQALRPLPHHVRLSRAPSLREYSHHLSRGLPRQVVNDELKSWHQRNQFREPRPRSLDRQGAIRVKNIPDLESPLAQHHMFQEQVPQRRVLQRAPDGTPVQWFVEVDSEIVSQV
ncbi:innate immunity activator b isoform X1 [Osmerus eperlanus]|uniref:innate immunity activator b isoform X1 n=2 Tax=Osmerus eperlanus TaxID=29151 RepID=UPI002E143719